ncbi:hypothetical protein Taro_008337, partial [Colocasia esculenta]|nr:hypothetical protein [Colocasia esculenta]
NMADQEHQEQEVEQAIDPDWAHDNVHNDGEVMRGTMNVITRLARTMNERLDAMAEVERYRMKLGIYRAYDMRCAAQRLTPGYFT